MLLRHTDEPGRADARRVTWRSDAVINAIIHRQLGETYSSMMASYYGQAQGLAKLLRPMRADGARRVPRWHSARPGTRRCRRGGRRGPALYDGKLLADDIEQLARDLGNSVARPRSRRGGEPIPLESLLGNHEDDAPLSEALQQALDRARKEMNGGGIWRNPGPGANRYELLVTPKHAAIAEWQARTLQVLRKHLEPAPGAPSAPVPVTARLPVLSTSDRRAFLRATWSPFLPEAQWGATALRPEGRAQVYLDVSGSMNAEMPLVVALLGRLSRWIRRPFWAFSTEVVPAVIERGVLKAGTSGGTSLECVIAHVEKTRPASAVIVTDGFVETIPKKRIAALARHDAAARHRHARRESVAAQGRGDPLLAAREVAEMIRVSEAVLPGQVPGCLGAGHREAPRRRHSRTSSRQSRSTSRSSMAS